MATTYAFKALDLAGVSTIGELEADDKQQVASQLRGKGLIVLDIEEKKSAADVGDMLARFKRVKAQELTIATRQLSTMVSSGMSLLRALYVLEEQTKSDKLKEALIQTRKDVEAGISLSDALRKHPDIFNDLYVAMVEAGELGGILESTLQRVADQLEKDDSLRRQVKSAMMYPALIGGFACTVLLALVTFLVPVFEKIFLQLGGQLPKLTQIVVDSSHLLQDRWYIIFPAFIGSIFAFFRWKRSARGRKHWDRFKLKVPMKIGDVVLKITMARFSRTLSTLVAAGVDIIKALEITGQTAGNWVIEDALNEVREKVHQGVPIATPLVENSVFPPMVAQMVKIGEETGELEKMLGKIADFYEDEVDSAIASLTAIIEPLMMIGVGMMVGVIIISMYLPMFKLLSLVK